MSNGTTLNVNCEAALDEYRRRVKWCERWDTLIFLFGTTVVGFSIIAILFFLRESYLSGAISTLGTIVSGTGIRWVQSRRKEVRSEWQIAKKELKNNCPEASAPLSLAGPGGYLKRNPFMIVAAIFICGLWLAPIAFFAYQVNETKTAKATAEFALGNQLKRKQQAYDEAIRVAGKILELVNHAPPNSQDNSPYRKEVEAFAFLLRGPLPGVSSDEVDQAAETFYAATTPDRPQVDEVRTLGSSFVKLCKKDLETLK